MSEKPPTVADLPDLWSAKATKVSTSNFTGPLTQYGNGVKDCASDLRTALAREAGRESTEAEVERAAKAMFDDDESGVQEDHRDIWGKSGREDAYRRSARAVIIALRRGG